MCMTTREGDGAAEHVCYMHMRMHMHMVMVMFMCMFMAMHMHMCISCEGGGTILPMDRALQRRSRRRQPA